MAPDDAWGEYRLLVLKQLETLTAEIKELRGDVSSLKVAVGMLQVRTAGIAAIVGILATLITDWLRK